MRTIAAVLVLCGLAWSGALGAPKPGPLDQAKAVLEAQVGGEWQAEPTDPDIGPMLRLKTMPGGLTSGFFGVLAFPQDSKGKKKLQSYLATRQAPLYVLGSNDRYTVITYTPRTHEVSKKVVAALQLAVPPPPKAPR